MTEIHIMSELFENFTVGFRHDSKIRLCGTLVYNLDGTQKKMSLYWAYQWNKYYKKYYPKEKVPNVNNIICKPCKNNVLQHIKDVENGNINTLYGLPIAVSKGFDEK